jgi:hypothetical protein|tara:strand:- start:1995 stop:2246 length:252 start_codon:yes stop_codon:yes gene_type:complete
MPEGQIADLWKVTSGIRSDISELLVSVARMQEREVVRNSAVEAQGAKLEGLERQLQILDRKIAAAMGMVLLIAWGLQLLVPAL